MKKLNLNDNVKVKLTSFGLEILSMRYKERNGNSTDFVPTIDENGYTEYQLWELMNIFGEYYYVGAAELPFELNEIIFKEEVLVDVLFNQKKL